ncbi:MAG TPA: site-specific integrase [Anaeromyxobacteraceae bacterium]|nr:site-specific integrase [Anaeromyxobacteraceae bacterium]
MTTAIRAPSRTRTIRFLTPEELRALLGAIRDKRDRAIFLAGYRHGLRASEMGLLYTNDLDLKSLRLMVHRVKGSHSGEHPLQPDEVRVLKAYLRARASKSPLLFPSQRNLPISRRTLDWLMKRYGERAGLPLDKSHFHCLKHSIATHMLSAGGDLVFVQDWLGHRNIENTRIYTFLTSTARDERARALFMKLPRF